MAEYQDMAEISAADFSAIIEGLDRKESPDDLKTLLLADLQGLGFPAKEIASVEVGAEC